MTDKPQEPSRFDAFESDHPRAPTPMDWTGSGSQPKLHAVTPIGFPRDARMPQSISEFERERASRDTEPSAPYDDEKTPAARPFEVRVERDLKALKEAVEDMKQHCRAAAENSLAAAELVRSLRLEMKSQQEENDKRFRRLELDRFWFPRIVSTAALVISLLTAGYVLAHVR